MDTPGEATFQFTAKKAGKTKISFIGNGTDGSIATPAIVDVTVEACRFQVTTTSIWVVPGEAKLILVAKIVKAELTADDQNHLSGTATVKWFLVVSRVEHCTGEIKAGTSTADLSGQVDADGELTVKVNYKQALVAINQTCVNRETVTGARTVPVTPD